MNKKGFVSIALAAAVVLMAGAGVILYRQRNSASILELAGKMENNPRVVSPNELPLAEQKEAAKAEPKTVDVWEKVVHEQKAAQKKTSQNQKNQIIQEQKKEPYIKVISPNGGEDLEAGTAYEIVWSSDGIEKNVQIDLRPKNAGNQIQINYAPNTGSYVWTMHESLNGEFKIIVRGMSDNEQLKDESDSYFTINNLRVPDSWNTYENQEYGIELKYPKESEVFQFEKADLIKLSSSYEHAEKLAAIVFDQDAAKRIRFGNEILLFGDKIQEEKNEVIHVGDIKLDKKSGSGSIENVDIYYEIYSLTKDGRNFNIAFAVLVDNTFGYKGNYDPYSEFPTFDYIINSLKFFEGQAPVLGDPWGLQIYFNGDIVFGDYDAPVTMIDYSSHLCGHCDRFYRETLPLLSDKYVKNGQMKIVHRYLSPVEFGMAAMCAREQGRFLDMNDYLFKNAAIIESPEDIKTLAERLKLDTDQFNSCFDSNKYEEYIVKWFEAAEESNVDGTPTFFINGQRINGNQPIGEFEKVIEEELAKVNF